MVCRLQAQKHLLPGGRIVEVGRAMEDHKDVGGADMGEAMLGDYRLYGRIQVMQVESLYDSSIAGKR